MATIVHNIGGNPVSLFLQRLETLREGGNVEGVTGYESTLAHYAGHAISFPIGLKGQDFTYSNGTLATGIVTELTNAAIGGPTVIFTGFEGLSAEEAMSLLNGNDALLYNIIQTTQWNYTGSDEADNFSSGELNDVLNSGAGTDILYGNGGNDTVSGGADNDTLYGGSGNDAIDGGIGLDTMYGGTGNDVFYADSISDKVRENIGEGSDTVVSRSSFTLHASAEIEFLRIANAAGNLGFSLTGNGFAQTITGNAGANRLNGLGGNDILAGGGGDDRLDGGTGTDKMTGGTGNDTYIVDNALDRVVEAAGGGTDRVATSVSFSLTAGSAVESLTTTASGGTGAINLAGNELAQSISGNAGASILTGKGGNDTLSGLGGNDQFFFQTALNAATNVDRITDFSNVAGNNDTIRLENAIFTALTVTGTLAAGFFVANASGTARDGNDRIIYETDTGKLFYDSNGSASGGSTHFATLTNLATLSAADFFVV